MEANAVIAQGKVALKEPEERDAISLLHTTCGTEKGTINYHLLTPYNNSMKYVLLASLLIGGEIEVQRG